MRPCPRQDLLGHYGFIAASGVGRRVPGEAEVADGRVMEPDNIREYRWWTRDGFRCTAESVYPHGLADLIAAVAEGRTPNRPIVFLAG